MSFRSFDLQRNHLTRISFSSPSDPAQVKKLGQELADEEIQDVHYSQGFHDFTISGRKYRLQLVAIWPDGDADEESRGTFLTSFRTRPEAPGPGVRLTRAEAEEYLERVFRVANEDIAFVQARFAFPDGFESPMIMSPRAGRELELEEDVETSGPLVRSGVRYTSTDRVNDVLIDGSREGVRLNLDLLWRGVSSLKEMRAEIGSLVKLAGRMVRERPDDEGPE